MDLAGRIAAIFPDDSVVPAEFRLDGLIEQREYLLNGEIRTWDGPLREALSPRSMERRGLLEYNRVR